MDVVTRDPSQQHVANLFEETCNELIELVTSLAVDQHFYPDATRHQHIQIFQTLWHIRTPDQRAQIMFHLMSNFEEAESGSVLTEQTMRWLRDERCEIGIGKGFLPIGRVFSEAAARSESARRAIEAVGGGGGEFSELQDRVNLPVRIAILVYRAFACICGVDGAYSVLAERLTWLQSCLPGSEVDIDDMSGMVDQFITPMVGFMSSFLEKTTNSGALPPEIAELAKTFQGNMSTSKADNAMFKLMESMQTTAGSPAAKSALMQMAGLAGNNEKLKNFIVGFANVRNSQDIASHFSKSMSDPAMVEEMTNATSAAFESLTPKPPTASAQQHAANVAAAAAQGSDLPLFS